jgi:hypothetical protein
VSAAAGEGDGKGADRGEAKRPSKPREANPAPKSKGAPKPKAASKPGATAKSKRAAKPGPAGRSRARRPAARLRRGEAIYLVAAIALFLLMFATWYGSEVSGAAEGIPIGEGSGGNAWQTLDVIPLFLMLAIAVAVGSALLRLSRSDWRPAVPPSAAVAVLGGLATLLILFRIVFPPGFGSLGGISIDATLKVGVFLALAAALGIAYGGYRALREEGDSFQAIAKRLESTKPKRPKPAAKSASKKRSPSSSD